MSELKFSLTPIPPFSLHNTAWALRRVPSDTMHAWDGKTFQRVLAVNEAPVLVQIEQSGTADSPILNITARSRRSAPNEEAITTQLNRLMGLQVDLTPFYRMSESSGRLSALSNKFRGLKPPRFPSVFEAFTNAVACQQISLYAGLSVVGKLMQEYGEAVPGSSLHSFPSPNVLQYKTPDELMALTFSRNKANYLIGVAQQLSSGALDFEALAALPDAELMERLVSIKGIGRWTAQYMLLRGYGRLNSFPIDDSGARGRLIDFLGMEKTVSLDRLERYINRWKPYSGLLYFHLLLYNLDKRGHMI
jgi:DNA-3-methyladenine glycosylase II